jgi:uncharacterized protein YdhG (YjbR/CyaY superfamily)
MAVATTVDEYIEGAPEPTRPVLRDMRRLILDAVPSVTEKISYGMPAYHHRGQRLVHFAASKAHVGVYGLVHEDGDVPPELAPYLANRSTLRFPLDQPLPADALRTALRRKAAQT